MPAAGARRRSPGALHRSNSLPNQSVSLIHCDLLLISVISKNFLKIPQIAFELKIQNNLSKNNNFNCRFELLNVILEIVNG